LHPIVIGGRGVEYNQLGEVCESSKQAKEEIFVWVAIEVLDNECFFMSSEKRARKSWSIHGVQIFEHDGVYLQHIWS
jgi:hypothetical protein